MKLNYLIIFSLLVFANNLFAQKIKYGYISYDKVLLEMPETKSANQELEGYAKQINEHINSKSKEYNDKVEELQKHKKSYNALVLKDKQNELNELAASIQEFQNNAQRDINKKRDELYGIAIAKLNNAIKDVAKAHNLRFVIRENSLLYSIESDNISDLVRKKLGIKK